MAKQNAPNTPDAGDDWEFRGFFSPTTTPVPDEVFDVLAPRLKEGELRVLLYIIRRTFGFKKRADNISLRQMVEGITTKDGQVLDEGTGLSKPSVIKSVQSLVRHKVIIATSRQSAERGFEATTYSLNLAQPALDSPPLLTKFTSPSKLGLPPLVNLDNPQQTVKQQTEEQQHVVALLQTKGITRNIAHRLAASHSHNSIRLKVEVLDYLVETDSPLVRRNSAGYLRKSIEEDYALPLGFKTREEREAERREQERGAKEAEQFRESHDPVARAMANYGTTEEELALWRQVQEQLRLTLAESTYSSYFRNAVLLSLDGNVATLGFPDSRTRDWATNRLAQSLQRAFEQVLERGVTVESTVLPAVE